MFYCQTFVRDEHNERVVEPIVQVSAEPDEDDYGWQSYVVLPEEEI